MDYYTYFYEIVFYSYLLPLVLAAALLFSGKYSREQNLILLLALSSLACEYIGVVLSKSYINNLFIWHLSICFDVSIFLAIFHHIVVRNSAKIAAFVIFDVILIACIALSVSGGLGGFPIYSGAITRIAIICMVIYFYFEVFRYEHIEDLSTHPVFWINSMYLLYFSGTFAYHSLTDQINSGNLTWKTTLVNWILIVIFNLVFTLALWLGRIRRT